MNLKDLKNSNILSTIFVDNTSNFIALEETLYSVSKQTYPVDLLVLYSNLSEEQVSALKLSLDNPKIILRKNVEAEDGSISIEEEVIESDKKINYLLQKTEKDGFGSIFNETFNAAIEGGYEFISIIEDNDIVGINWYKQAAEYASENENLSIFFPIIRNTTNGVFSSLMNEAPWAEGMAEEAGKLDLNLLSRFNCILPLGAIFKVSALKEYSEERESKYFPFKESIKLSHYYEFFMRMVYNDLKGMCVPRIGYEVRIKASDYFKHYSCKIPQNIAQIPLEKGGISPEEGKFWMDLAKKEYFFDNDRNKVYEEKQ